MKISKVKVALFICATLFITIAVTGCYENDPLPESVTTDKLLEPVAVDQVAGLYEFTRFEFVPNDTSMASVSMLDTLISQTELKLGTDDRFVLSYHVDGGAQRTIGGAMKVTTDDVRLDAERGNDEALAVLLLGDLITLEREDKQLRASISSTIDSNSVFNTYEGLPHTDGILEIRLMPRATH